MRASASLALRSLLSGMPGSRSRGFDDGAGAGRLSRHARKGRARRAGADRGDGPHAEIRPHSHRPRRDRVSCPGREAGNRPRRLERQLLRLSLLRPRLGQRAAGGPARRHRGQCRDRLLRLEGVAIAEVAEVGRRALERAALEDPATVTSIAIERNITLLPEPSYGDVRWSIDVRSERDSARVYADAAGNVVAADLSQTNRAKDSTSSRKTTGRCARPKRSLPPCSARARASMSTAPRFLHLRRSR